MAEIIGPSIHPEADRRIAESLAKQGTPADTRRRYFLYRDSSPKVRDRRSRTPLDINHNPWIRLGDDGEITGRRWQPTKHVTENPEVLNQRPRNGWDYQEHPPKGRAKIRETFPTFDNINSAVRWAIKVKNRNAQEVTPEAKERWQMMLIAERLEQLEELRTQWSELTDEQIANIVADNVRVLEQAGIVDPVNPEKVRIKEMLEKGFVDRNGDKNALAAYSRDAGVELALNRRLWGVVEHAWFKYEGIRNMLSQELGITLTALEQAEQILAQMSSKLVEPPFSDPDFRRFKPDDLNWALRSFGPMFDHLQLLLTRRIRVMPYTQAWSTAVELGAAEQWKQGPIWELRQAREQAGEKTGRWFLWHGQVAEAVGIITTAETQIRLLRAAA